MLPKFTIPKVSVYHVNSNKFIPEQSVGTASTVCVPSSCMALTVGTAFSYEVIIAGPASTSLGVNWLSVTLTDTSINGWENYGDTLQTLVISYTVVQPACSMGSANTITLPFGTLNSNDFANSQQVANITMNCTRATQATATLVPTQAAISGQTGVSATTLAGLSMACFWK